MNCPTCGKELYDNGEDRFNCPFCGAEVVSDAIAANKAPQDRCQTQRGKDWHKRANRREYWIKALLCLAIMFVIFKALSKMSLAYDNKVIALVAIGCGLAITLYWLFNVVCRRLHDFGRSGWWIVLFIIIDNMLRNLVLNCTWAGNLWETWTLFAIAIPIVIGVWPGTHGYNKYGDVPPK